MEVHRQQCQHCRSYRMRILIVRDPRDVVFVQCVDCKHLVARYELADYLHYGKGVESYLQFVARNASQDSGREVADLGQREQESREDFARALKVLRESGKDFPE